MNKQDLQKQHERVLRDSAQVKEHFKMYKVGKTWLFAGLFTISLGASIVMGDHPDVHAATTETDPETSQSTATQTNLQAKKVVIGDKTQSQDSAPEMKAAADTTQTTTEPETQNTATQKTAAQNADAQSSTNVKTPATSDTQAQAATANVQTTNLGDVTDESTIEQAKTAAAKTYAQTGTPQQVTAISGVQGNSTTAADPVQAVSATVEDASKTYDNQSDTPATFNVKLSDNLTAPTGWFFTGNENEYKVSASSGDIDLSKVNQNVGSYDITLSDAGLARLNAVQANQTKNLVVSAVTAGKLTIKKASVVTGSVAIENTSKLYDNDATTDPTSFKVTVSSELKAPTDWTVNADGSYTVTIASGDIQANIDSQEPGTYTVNLTASGLQKLNAANSNYNTVASNVTVGNFQIQNNTKLSIGTVRMKTTDTGLPATVTVSVSRHETVPTDWKVGYDNTGQEDIVYKVPISYFDTSNVNKTTVTSYPLNLTTTALNNLNAANPNTPIKSINIQPGRIIIADGSVNTPVRNLSNFGGGGGNLGGRILSDGDGATLKLGIFGSSTATITNFTDVIIIPAGLAVANVTTDSTDPTKITSYTKADDPVDVIKNNITQTLATTNTSYTDLTVGQLPDYKGRQAFYFKLGTVTESGDKASVPLNVVVDPDITNVATGNFGDRTVENDAAILYATDDNAYTDGAYTINTGGAYPNIPVVANGLGLTNTETISDTYDNGMWAGSYTIKHIPVQTTYNLKDAAGNIIASAVKTSGMVGDAYDPLTVIPEKITATDGTQYILDRTSVPDESTFKKDATVGLKPEATLATGINYTAIYKKVIDTTQDQVKIANSQMTWKSATPSTMTVTLPDSLKAPDGWTKTAGTGNTYTVNTADGDLDLSAVQSPAGPYDVTLSKQGLTKLAAVNPDYLFDNTINGVGTLTVNPIKVPVTVKDTAGTTLKENVPDIQLGVNDAGTGADAGVDGYPTAQLKSVTFNYAQNDNNTTGVKSATLVADKTAGTITVTTTYYGTKPQSVATMTQDELGGADAGTGLALQLNDGSMGSGIGFNVTPQITTAQAGTMAALTGIDVVYNQKVTATLVPSDGDGNPIPNTTPTTVNDFPGNSVSVPNVPGYTATTSNVTIPNGPDFTVKVTYTPNTQTVKVQFVDQDGNKLGDAIDLTGGSDSNIDYTKALNIQKTLVSQGYFPINGDKTGFATAPKVFDHDDKATPTITVKLSKFNDQVPADATLVPVDPNGNPIKNTTPTTVTGLPGTDVTAPDVPGYTVTDTDKTVTIPTPVPNKDNVTNGKVTTPDKRGTTVNVTYVPNTQTVKVQFVDQDGNKLGDATDLTGGSDSNIDYTPALNTQKTLISQGYLPINGDKTGFATAPKVFDHDDTATPTITVKLTKITPISADTTLVPVDQNGDPIKGTTPTVVTDVPGKTINVPTIPGYTPKNGNTITVPTPVPNKDNVTNGKVTTTPDKRGNTVDVEYTPDAQSIKVQFVDQDGNQLGDVTTLTGVSDSNVDLTPAIKTEQSLINTGYTPVKGNQNGLDSITKAFTDYGKVPTYIVQLTKISDTNANLTLVPSDVNGNPIPNTTPTTVTGVPGTDVTTPDVPGYTVISTDKTVTIPTPVPNKNNVTGGKATTPDKRGTTVNVTYVPNTQTVKVQFVDQNGNKLADATDLTGRSDSNIDYTPALNTQKILISQGYLPINGDKTGFATASKVFDHDDKNTPTVTVTLAKITPISADTTLVPVDKNGNPIKGTTPTVVTEVPGKTVTVPSVPGYTATNTTVTIPTPEPNKDNVTNGKVTTPDKRGNTVNVEYTPDAQSIKVQFVDQDGNQLGDVTTLTGVSDSDVDLTPAIKVEQSLINTGYTPVKGNQNGLDSVVKAFTAYGKVPTYTVQLTKISDTAANLTLVPSDVNGDPIPNTTPTTVTGVPGKTITVPSIPGYTTTETTVTIPTPVLSKDNVTGGKVTTPDKRGTTLKIIYIAKPQTITINFTDEKGNDLGSEKLTGQTDGAVDTSAVITKEQSLINQGYTPKKGLSNGLTGIPANFTDKSQTFTIQLTKITPISADTTLVPVDENGNPIKGATPTVVTDVPGKTVNVPTISGYTPKNGNTITVPTPEPNKDNVTTPDKRGNTVNVEYTPDAQSIKVQFVDQAGNQLGNVTTLTGVSDGDVDYSPAFQAQQALLNQGYTLKKGNNNGLVSASKTYDRDDNVTPTYVVVLTKINNVKVTATLVPVGEDGKTPIPNTTSTTVHDYPGTNVAVPEIPGYTATTPNVPVPAGKDNTVKVKYIANAQDITVNFLDDKTGAVLGTTVIHGKTDGKVVLDSAIAAEQSIISLGNYTPKVGLNNGLAGLPATFANHSQTFNVQLTKINNVKVTVNLVPFGSDGKLVPNTTPTTVHDYPGTNVITPNVPGYTPTNALTTIPKTNGDVSVVYVPNSQTINVHFVDDKGNDLGTTTLTGVSDANVDYNPAFQAQQDLLNQGYTLKKGNNNGLDSATKTYDRDDDVTPTYEVVLTKVNNVKVTSDLTPKLPNGDPVPGSQVTTVNNYPGTVITNPSIPGYTPTTDTTTIPPKNGEVDVVYTPNTVTGTVDIPSNKGSQTVPNVTGKTGDHVTVDVPTIPGYTPDKTTVPATVNPDGTITVDGPDSKPGDKNYVNYTADPQSVKVQFVDDKGADLGAVTINGHSDETVDYSGVFAKEQDLLNQGYTLSKGDNNGLVSATKTFTQYGKVPTYVVELSHVEGVELDKVPTDNVPYANQYTVNFVTPNGDVVGKVTVPANPGVDNTVDITPDIPAGYVPTPGNDKILVNIPKGADPKTPITVNITTPAGKDTDPIQVWNEDEVPTDNVPSAHQYTINFVTPSGDVVGTATVVGNPGNHFNVSGNVPNGYVLNGTDGDVEVPNNQDPSKPITVSVTVPANPSDNGGTTDVPGGSSTDNGTGTPTDGPDTTTDGSDNNTVPGGDETDNNTTTGGKTDNNVISTDNGQKTVGQPTSLSGTDSNAGATQSGLVHQSSQAAAIQPQQTSNSSANNSGATANKAGSLPQTNEQNTSVWALLGLGLMSMLSLLGFTKQKKREDDK
ncbi:mucus-binding protein, LPXTG-motif cell wall anchor [Secundilactobacillus silagincola]|uniref:Mucus-binding protein, LPXTG-motif cell wall anchor n=1 Tax=Secundilactobacillus silagincola TaxID=1714681 RepID=A0A1Z5IZW5_9LACO|nr:MBG domain-containing protein [Secundilactobacillus silagincola]GAX07327.1 mucus-binding protein, LPXTG-motif cell wall anchor [Secundilactobacillus silagincola]